MVIFEFLFVKMLLLIFFTRGNFVLIRAGHRRLFKILFLNLLSQNISFFSNQIKFSFITNIRVHFSISKIQS